MSKNVLSVRELQQGDISSIVRYWLNSDSAFLVGMGVDLDKLPTAEEATEMLLRQLNTPIEEKNAYCMIWLVDGRPIGHCNTNPTNYGEDASMHLHIWDASARKKGFGAALVKMTLPGFFENLRLKNLYCEPYALNPGPNKTLEKVGFELVKEYTTIPGSVNFEQPVKRWKLSYDRFQLLK